MNKRLFLSLAVLAIFAGSPASAGTLLVRAESFHPFEAYSGAFAGCVRETGTGGNSDFPVVQWACDGTSGGALAANIPFPPGGSNTWNFRLHGLQYDTGTCNWRVRAVAYPTGAAPTFVDHNLVASATLASDTSVVPEEETSQTTSAYTVLNGTTGGNCSGSTCVGMPVELSIILSTSSTSDTCNFRMLAITY